MRKAPDPTDRCDQGIRIGHGGDILPAVLGVDEEASKPAGIVFAATATTSSGLAIGSGTEGQGDVGGRR